MKKIFALLLFIWIPIYLLFGLLASCKKSSITEENSLNKTTSAAQSENTKSAVVGKWQLTEFFQDPGNGHGIWINAQVPEQVSFTAAGDFAANEYFPPGKQRFNKYRIIDSAHIELYSTQSKETATYYFRRESEANLLFHPVCKEMCARRYELIE